MAKKEQKKHFFKDFKAELKKVIWPTSKQVVNNTIAVIVIVLITAVIVFVLDLVFDLFNNYGINKIKANIKNQEEIVNVENPTAENEITDGDETIIEGNEIVDSGETINDENEITNTDNIIEEDIQE